MLRTHKLNEVNEKLAGKKVRLTGWVDTIREHGNVMFIDLRDRYGKVQMVITKKAGEEFKKAKKLTLESCVGIEGEVKERPKGTVNNDLDSGKVEIKIEKVEIYSIAGMLPFKPSDSSDVAEDIRLRYRYLDLRNERMIRNLELRHKIVNFIREYLDDKDFLEITTPMLTKSTPEGARDFIVPSRIHPGKFYALPQSPQQYKQLLMVSGVDKYFQIAPCFRDEDARADRSPGEFFQLDLEMSFIEQDDLLDLIEDMMLKIVKKLLPGKKLTFEKFPRLTYEEVMKKYKTDKPDLRKDKNDPNELAFCFVVDFPLFEPELERGHYAPMHHMFTRPKEEDIGNLTKSSASKVKSYQHDLVLNGFEVGGGSMRIHDSEVQSKIFDLIGFTKQQKEYFEHMLTAFGFGVPPHGGIAPGIDRLVMVLLGENSIRETIAFPKNREAKDVLMDAPSAIDEQQLKDVHIKLDLPEKKKKGKKSSSKKKKSSSKSKKKGKKSSKGSKRK